MRMDVPVLNNPYAQISTLNPESEKGEEMPRPANKERVNTVSIEAVREMDDWGQTLETSGFDIKSFQYNSAGLVLSATCEKNGRDQVITPEIKDILLQSNKPS